MRKLGNAWEIRLVIPARPALRGHVTVVHEYKEEFAEVLPKSKCLNLPSPNFQNW